MGHKAGRPPKLTKRVTETICNAIGIGTPLSAAAVYGGITYPTFTLWVNRGEKARILQDSGQEVPESELEYLTFFNNVQEAKANAGVTWANVLNTAANNDPNFAFRMLQVWFPDTYNPPQKHEVTLQNKIITLLKEGKVTFTDVVEELGEELTKEIITQAMGHELATQLFNSIATTTAKD